MAMTHFWGNIHFYCVRLLPFNQDDRVSRRMTYYSGLVIGKREQQENIRLFNDSKETPQLCVDDEMHSSHIASLITCSISLFAQISSALCQ